MMKYRIVIMACFLFFGIQLFAQNGKGIESEFFEIQILKSDVRVWNDQGSGAVRDLYIWKAKKPTGYYLFGYQLTNKDILDSMYTSTIALKVKPEYISSKLIVNPDSFEEVWNSSGTGIDPRIYIWRAKCPEGYVSLGMVATPYNDATGKGTEPDKTDCGCIKEEAQDRTKQMVDLVKEAKILTMSDDVKSFWDDKGTDEEVAEVSLWLTTMNGPTEQGHVMLTSNSFFASNKREFTPYDKPYAFNLKFNINLNKKVSLKTPSIKPPFPPDEMELKSLEITNTDTVPFFAVKDDKYPSMLDQFLACPNYIVVRKTRYKYVNHFSCPLNGSKTSFSYAITNSISKEENWQNALGISVGYSFSIGAEATSGVATASTTHTFSIEASYNRSWGGSTTQTDETTHEFSVELEPGQTAVILQESNEFQVFRVINGKKENSPFAQYTQGDKSHIPLYFNDPKREQEQAKADNTPKGNITGISAYGKYFVELKPDGRLIINTLDEDAKICTGVKMAASSPAVNIAKGKNTSQSSEYTSTGFGSEKAVDGNKNGYFSFTPSQNSITHTNPEVAPWWEIDLGSVQDIEKIVIWNRKDCCWERLQGFSVVTSVEPISYNKPVEVLGPFSPWTAAMESYSINFSKSARYIRIQLNPKSDKSNQVLNIAEVEVFAR